MWSSGLRACLFAGVVLWGSAILPLVGCSQRSASDDGAAAARLDEQEAVHGLVISQVYGGAPDQTATWNRDFVQLHNPTDEPISLEGLSLHAAGSQTDFVVAARLPRDKTIAPGGYFLVGFVAGQFGADLPVNGTGDPRVNIPAVHGKIALARDAVVDGADAADPAVQQLGCGAVGNRCQDSDAGASRIVDLVGYGEVSDYEVAPAPSPSTRSAVRRKNAGAQDTNDNASDFEVTTVCPNTVPSIVCGPPITGDAGEADGGDPEDSGVLPDPDAGEEESDAAVASDAGAKDAGKPAPRDAGSIYKPSQGEEPPPWGAGAPPRKAADAGRKDSLLPETPEADIGACSVASAPGAGPEGYAPLAGLVLSFALAVTRRRKPGTVRT